jgi:CheY-like chemotaxis protein
MSSSVPEPPPLAVLFVDPDRAGAQLLANVIRDRYATAVVGSAREAYDAMRFQTPTLIVCELRLPDVNGADFLAQLRGHPATRHILLMVVSSTRSVQHKVRAFQAGADDFLVKPVEPATFLAHFLSVIRFRQIVGPSYGSHQINPSPHTPDTP